MPAREVDPREVDMVLAESDREIDSARVARMQRSGKPDRKKQGRLLRAVLDYREAYGVGPQPRDADTGQWEPYEDIGQSEGHEDASAD